MMGLSRLYKTGKHVVANSHSTIGCHVRNLGSYTHSSRVDNHYVIIINIITMTSSS